MLDDRLQSQVFGWVYVADGDTLNYQEQKIRLYGIDAPEHDQLCTKDGIQYACGRAARQRLKEIIGRAEINCTHKDTDKYGRSVSICYVGDQDINEQMVREGWALAYRQYSNIYIAQEKTAKDQKLGIWAGEFERPDSYRRKYK